jgi:hypothetical protein
MAYVVWNKFGYVSPSINYEKYIFSDIFHVFFSKNTNDIRQDVFYKKTKKSDKFEKYLIV